MQVWLTIKTILASKNKLKKGFTLVELLVVIVILGVLSTLGVVSVTKIINTSKEKVFKQEAITFINAARTKSAETIVPDGGLCYSIFDLAEYVEKDITGYSGSVFVSSDNKYKIWLSKGSYIINAGTVDDMNLITNNETEASSICPYSFLLINVDTNGGTWSGSLPVTVYEGQKLNLGNISEPTKSGSIFNGWTVIGNNSEIVDNILTVGNESLTLVANWT